MTLELEDGWIEEEPQEGDWHEALANVADAARRQPVVCAYSSTDVEAPSEERQPQLRKWKTPTPMFQYTVSCGIKAAKLPAE